MLHSVRRQSFEIRHFIFNFIIKLHPHHPQIAQSHIENFGILLQGLEKNDFD